MPLPRDVGSGGRNGIVLNLTLSGDGIWNAVYSVKVVVGRNEQPFMLSIDSGSSDLWIASKSCSSSPCSGAHTSLYDPSSSTPAGSSIQLSFLRGSASGPIVWDTFKIGPYTIPAQALVAADDVSEEALSSNFVGLLGLALPPNSNIAKQVPSTETDSPDGATLQMNLFGLTPVDTAPLQRFISMSLERPGSNRIASQLGVGMHPPNLVPGFNPSNVVYSELVSSRLGDTFWRVPVMNITAWVDGVPKPIHLGRSVAVPTSTNAVALVDTGGSGILTTVDIANAIYGAWGIGPGQDGNYYVPCTTPMNISIGLANFPPIALHPLDLTSLPLGSKASIASTTTCVGQIQAVSSDKLSEAADIVLGVAFLRNVYTVLSSSESSTPTTKVSPSPRLGLFPVTDPITAMDEFHTVRVLGLPLQPSSTSSPKNTPVTVGKKLSVGVTVLVCIVGFFVACGLLFGMRWCIMERRFRRLKRREAISAAKGLPVGGHKENGNAVDEDTLRSQRWEERKKQGLSFYQESTTGSDFTRIEQNGGPGVIAKDEVGALIRPTSRSRSLSPTPSSSAASEVAHAHGSPGGALAPTPPDWNKTHVRTISEEAERRQHGNGGAVVPLLEDDAAEYSPWSDAPPPHERMPSWAGSVSFATAVEAAERDEREAQQQGEEEEEEMDAGMAGIGARSSMASSAGAAAATARSPSSTRQRPRGPRASSGASISSMASRMWHAEVGEILAPRQRASHAS